MKLTLYGSPTAISKAEAREAVLFYAGRLLSRQLRPHLTVKVFFKAGMLKDTKLEASCSWDDENLRPREFVIRVDSALSKRGTLLALAHEVVHIKQYAKGELRYYMRGAPCRWLGKPVDESATLYYDLPWEKEAWDLEQTLYKEFMKHAKAGKGARQKSSRARPKVSALSEAGGQKQEGLH